jgi:hypothetical protein
MPLVSASSTTQVSSGSRSTCASTGSPSGPRTRTRSITPPSLAEAIASIVPSPPSAIGAATHSSSGRTERQPRTMAAATSAAGQVPLNESGQMTMRRCMRQG